MSKKFLNRNFNISNNNNYLEDHFYVVSNEACLLEKTQIESCINTIRFYIRKYKKKKKKKFVSVLEFNIPVTKKTKFSRMGSGKGKIVKYVSKVNKNGIIFIFKDLKRDIMFKIYKYIKNKLPVKVSLEFV